MYVIIRAYPTDFFTVGQTASAGQTYRYQTINSNPLNTIIRQMMIVTPAEFLTMMTQGSDV